ADKRLKLEQQIIQIVNQKRRSLPREGVRKLKISLKNEFDKANLKVGRDTLFNILRKHNMLITRKKPSYRTTNSFHRFYKHKNIIKDVIVNRPNQVWVSDNAIAERVNGILKDEFYLDQTFDSVQHAKKATKSAINLYNQIRLHVSLDYKTPNMVYLKTA
ncbi:integrase core domain-containing protein, partial [Pontimicrobium aquaticum]